MTMNILKGLHRRALGLAKDGEVMARAGIVAGGEDKPVITFPGPDTVAVWEDFIGAQAGDTGALVLRYGTQLIIGWSDTGQVIPAQGPVQAVAGHLTNGVFRMTSSASSTQTPVGGAQSLNTPANWKANQGQYAGVGGKPLRFGVRLKIATLLGNNVFAGFSDTGGTEIPVYDTGGGIITPAADYAGWLKGGGAGAGATAASWRLVAGKAGADQVNTPSPVITPTANVYDVLEVEVSPDGNVVTGYINGIAKAQILGACITSTVALGAGVWRSNTEGAADVVDIDWINIAAPRDTGT